MPIAIVFGGAGFVGLNIAEALGARGVEVRIFDRASPPPRFAAPVRFIEGDVRNAAAASEAIVDGADWVLWGAAITSDAVREAASPEEILETNLNALVPVLRRARKAGVRRFLNLSSVAAYGEAMFGDTPLEESAACEPASLYAISKFASERLCSRLADLWSLDVASVRLSAVFGPWERAGGSRDTPSPFLQVTALAKRKEVARLARPGLRDWIYGPDAAAAVLSLLEAPRLQHRLYNIGTGTTFTVLDWASEVPGLRCRLCEPGEHPNVDLGASRDRAPLSIARLQAETPFAPRFGTQESARHFAAWLAGAQ